MYLMGRHVAGEMPELDRLVDDACAGIGREIGALCVPMLSGVVLGGGYGRGEGGAREKLESRVGVGERNNSTLELQLHSPTLSNDLDFFAITEDGVPEAEAVAGIGAALKPISEKWTAKLGVDVDFTVRTPWRIRHDLERLMIQELLRGYCDVAGTKGETLFSGMERIDAAKLPWMEAARLLMNRGMGMLLAMSEESWSSEFELEKGALPSLSNSNSTLQLKSPTPTQISNSNSNLQLHSDFVVRNINKCILGAGDARLIARHAYAWRAEERAKALGDELYGAAVEWKFRPKSEPVCSWEKAREVWLEALEEVSGNSGGARSSRTLRNAARWIVRRRSIGELRTFALDPVVRILETVARHVRKGRKASDSLMRDWRIFN